MVKIECLTSGYVQDAIRVIHSLPGFFYERDLRKAEENYNKYVSGDFQENAVFKIALRDGQVVGIVGAIKRSDADQVYFLASFAVKKGERGNGIGKKILSNLEEELQEKGARLLFTETTTSSYCDSTRAFYEAMEYKCVSVVEDFWADGDDLALYQKRLSK